MEVLRIKKLYYAVFFFAFLIGCDALTSSGITGSVFGSVKYSDGMPIEDALVSVGIPGSSSSDTESGSGYSVTTAADGGYNIPGLSPGTYSVTAEIDGQSKSQVVELKGGEWSCSNPEKRADFVFKR